MEYPLTNPAWLDFLLLALAVVSLHICFVALTLARQTRGLSPRRPRSRRRFRA